MKKKLWACEFRDKCSNPIGCVFWWDQDEKCIVRELDRHPSDITISCVVSNLWRDFDNDYIKLVRTN